MKPRPFAQLLLLLGLGSCRTLVAPDPAFELEASEVRVDHELFEGVLRAHVDERGRVDYEALVADPLELERYYAQLAAVSPDSDPGQFETREEQLAYWLNAYNGCVLVSVARLWPLESVERAPMPWLLGFLPDLAGFFYLRNHVLGGRRLNLKDLEDELVRERYGDARTHFALNCASASCPQLPREAFAAATLDEQLEREARAFLARPDALRVEGDTVFLSSILDWYAEDFLADLEEAGVEQPSLVDYAALYAPEGLALRLAELGPGARVEFLPYDWSLNSPSLVRAPVPAP